MPISQQSLSDNSKADTLSWWGMAMAFGAALVAGLCCIGPFIYLVSGLSVAGLARWVVPGRLEVPLAVVSVLCLVMVFWRLYLKQRPCCTTRAGRYMRPAFWLIVLVSAVLLTYPYLLGWWLA